MRMRFAAVLLLILAFAGAQGAERPRDLRQVQTIPLANVQGRIDHMGVDVQGRRLFVSALGNNTLEVLDVRGGKRLTSITGLKEPQGVFFVGTQNKMFVANGGDGTCRVFDGASYKLLSTVNFSSDADNVRYDAAENEIYLGYGEGALAVMNASNGVKIADIALSAHPESFRLETSGRRIFVNLPNANHTIAVVDRAQRSVVATWPVAAEANFPMALDERDHRLFVTTRRPAKLIVLDTESGKEVAGYPAVGDADDLFYDAARRLVYISGGEGFMDVFRQRDPDHYELSSRVPTAVGARTSLLVPELNRIYLAVPRRGNQGAEIRTYELRY